MKLTYEYEPPKYEVLNGNYRVNYNIEQTTEMRPNPETGEETIIPVWVCDCVEVATLDRNSIIVALIRKTYSLDDEIAIQRQRDTRPEDFAAYFEEAERCKAIANGIFSNE